VVPGEHPGPIALDQYDALVLQGGGARCFYTLGFLKVAGPALTGVRQVVAVSAATAMACAHLAGDHREAMELFAARVRKNPRNFYLGRALRGQWPTPHLEMYRGTMSEFLTPARFAQIREHAQALRIVVAKGPLQSKLLTVGLAALAVLRPRPAPLLRAHVLCAADMQHEGELVDAVMASSAFPPFTPMLRLPGSGLPLIDGGTVAPVPVVALAESLRPVRPLVLLTRPIPRLPLPAGLALVGPRYALPMATWEYTDEPGLRHLYEVGCRDGENFLRTGAVRRS
jgi:predicted acylesterase/phospholipase RssA